MASDQYQRSRVLDAGGRLLAGVRNASQLADLAQKHGDRLHVVALDVTDEAAVQTAGGQAFGRLDVLVNNAGYGRTAPFEQMSAEDFRGKFERLRLDALSELKRTLEEDDHG